MSRREWQEPLRTKTETKFSSLEGPPTAITPGKAGVLGGPQPHDSHSLPNWVLSLRRGLLPLGYV